MMTLPCRDLNESFGFGFDQVTAVCWTRNPYYELSNHRNKSYKSCVIQRSVAFPQVLLHPVLLCISYGDLCYVSDHMSYTKCIQHKVLRPTKANMEKIEKRPKCYITRKESFCAAHRLHNPALTNELNAEIFGKCNHKNGHGHNYTVEVTVQGAIDVQTGMVMNLTDLKKHLAVILEDLDHRNLDIDVEYFSNVTSTAENLAVYFWKRLEGMLPQGSLYKVIIHETGKNTATYKGELA